MNTIISLSLLLVQEVGLLGFFNKIKEDFMQKAEMDLADPMINYDPKSRSPSEEAVKYAYTSSYFMGYGAEQAVSTLIISATGAGVIKLGAKVVEILGKFSAGQKIVKAATELAARARQAKTSFVNWMLKKAAADDANFKLMLQGLEALDNARRAVGQATSWASQPLIVLGKALEKLENLNPGKAGMQILFERLGTKIGTTTKLAETWLKAGQWTDMERFTKRSAQTAETLEPFLQVEGDAAKIAAAVEVASAMEGWAKIYNRLDVPGHLNADGLPGRVEDLRAALKADTPEGAQCLKRTLGNANTAVPDAKGRPKVMVKGMEAVHPTLYHHCSEANLPLRLQRKVDGSLVLTEFDGARGWYVTADRLDTLHDASAKLQLLNSADGRFRVKFSTAQATENLKAPYGKLNEEEWLEMLTHDDPTRRGGVGGASQFLLEHKEVVIDEIFDTTLGRALTPAEVSAIFPLL